METKSNQNPVAHRDLMEINTEYTKIIDQKGFLSTVYGFSFDSKRNANSPKFPEISNQVTTVSK